MYICNPAHRVSRPRGTGSVGDRVGEGERVCCCDWALLSKDANASAEQACCRCLFCCQCLFLPSAGNASSCRQPLHSRRPRLHYRLLTLRPAAY